MKKLNSKTIRWLVCTIICLFIHQHYSFSQKEIIQKKVHCESNINPELYKSYWEDKTRNSDKYNISRSNDPFVIPVRIIGLRRTNGTGSSFPNSVGGVNFMITKLNNDYAGTNVTFEHCGEPIFIDSDYYYENFRDLGDYQFGPGLSDFGPRWDHEIALELAYFSSDANSYLPQASLGANTANFPCVSNDPLMCLGFEPDNILRFKNLNTTHIAAHEFGHHLGVLHPEEGQTWYDIEIQQHVDDPSWSLDHPDAGTLRARELVIRNNDPLAPFFKFANCGRAADFCCDTPVSGISIEEAPNSASFWPAPGFPNCCDFDDPINHDPVCCDNIAPGIYIKSVAEGCVLYGPYEDYNGQKFEEQVGMDDLAQNIMTNFNGCVQDKFTSDQIDRMHRFHELRRSNQYQNALCGNHEDQVTHWNGPEIMNEVSIQNRHPGNNNYANTFTSHNGNFSSILYDNSLTSHVRKLGSEGLDNYLPQDWRRGITVTDIVLLARKIIGLADLNGYQQLAGDVDNDGLLTIFDVLEMRKILVLLSDQFEHHSAPWKFVPEYIPNVLPLDFDTDPFNMTINGVNTNGLPIYTEKEWLYQLFDGNNGLAGFHGYKLGDLNKTSSSTAPPTNCHQIDIEIAEQIIPSNQIIEVGLSFQQNISLEAFQLDFDFHPMIEVVEVNGFIENFENQASSNIFEEKGSKKLKMAWLDVNKKSTLHNEKEISIVIKSSQSLPLSEVLSIAPNSETIAIIDLLDCTTITQLFINADLGENNLNSKIVESSGLTIYPNPVKDYFQISLSNNDTQNSLIELLDITGRKVVSFRTHENLVTVNTTNLSPGVYQILVTSGSRILTEKVIIE